MPERTRCHGLRVRRGMAPLPICGGLPDDPARDHAQRLRRLAGALPCIVREAHRPRGGDHRRDRRAGGVRMTRSAREVVELYNLVVWNERDFALAEELMGDTVVRHEVGEANTLTHEEAVHRIVYMWEVSDELRFDLNLVVAGDDGEHVAIVYESPIRLKDGTETTIGSMEIFRVIDGRITEVWNCGYQQGVWS